MTTWVRLSRPGAVQGERKNADNRIMTIPVPVQDPATSALFSDAPSGPEPPASAKAVYKARMHAWKADHKVMYQVWLVLFIGGTIAAATGAYLAGGPITALKGAGVVFVPCLLAGVFVTMKVGGSADDEYWTAYATARGLRQGVGGSIGCDVPLLGLGDERETHFVLHGRIAGVESQLAQYTYTDITHSTDSHGNRTTNREDHDFTLLAMPLPDAVAARFRGVYCRRKSLSLGGIQDKLAHDRAIKLESVDFCKRYSLRVVDDQDDIALYELFSTTFLDELASASVDDEAVVQWEQVGPNLVMFVEEHVDVTVALDALCGAGARVRARYLQEHM